MTALLQVRLFFSTFIVVELVIFYHQAFTNVISIVIIYLLLDRILFAV